MSCVMNKIFRIAIVACAAALGGTLVSDGAVAYVDGTRAGGNGTSWSQAFKTLDAAIAASPADTDFWIARGTYTPAGTLYLTKANQRFYGGFAGNESTFMQRNITANPVTLDGRSVLRHLFFVHPMAVGAVFDGLQIVRGRATISSGWDSYGGGIFSDRVSIQVSNCAFTDNRALLYGGAVFVNRAPFLIQNCSFTDNAGLAGGAVSGYDADAEILGSYFADNVASGGGVDSRGGAIWLALQTPVITGCTFVGNRAYQAAGVEINLSGNAAITDCSFSNNIASMSAGGVGALASTLTVTRCRFVNNSSGDNGGGFWDYYSFSSLRDCLFYKNTAERGGGVQLDYRMDNLSVIERCVFLSNSARVEGGGLHSYVRSVRCDNSLFVNNSSEFGGGIRLHGGDGGDRNYGIVTVFRNCVIYGNSATKFGGGMINSVIPNLQLFNCIFWANSAGGTLWDPGQGKYVAPKDINNTGSSSMTTRHCDIETLTWMHSSVSESHTGSFSANPQFFDPDGADNLLGTEDDRFDLQSTSPCLDRADGNNAPAQDYAYKNRVDLPNIPNLGIGNPNYADIGILETAPKAGKPYLFPNGGFFETWFYVALTPVSPGTVVRFTMDGSTPTESSPVAPASVLVQRTVTIKAKAFGPGYSESDLAQATFVISDRDLDGLPDWMETGTGIYNSPTNTGTNPDLADTDGDGFNDGIEVQLGTNPNDPNSKPKMKNDFDGDGRSDYGLYYPPTGDWYFRRSTAGFRSTQFGFSGVTPVTGDFDGDGKTDYGVYHPPTGDWYFMRSTNGFGVSQFGFAGTVPVTGDFDGDGKTDYGVYHPPTGDWYLMQSAAGLKITQFGFAGTVPVTGDFDGDGKTDYGVYHPPTGDWYLMRSAEGFKTMRFGVAGSVPVTGDFDSDGKADCATYYAPRGDWYFSKSAEGLVYVQFGFLGTMPVTGDFDGDGKSDYACYHPASGNWYFMRSRDGFMTTQFGFAGTKPLGSD